MTITTNHDPYAEDMARCHELLWDFRNRAASWWPTPDRDDALRFAVTKAGKALDAWLRANRPQYARNRDRLNGEEAVLDELTDCVMMLLTALGSTPVNLVCDWRNMTSWGIDEIWGDIFDVGCYLIDPEYKHDDVWSIAYALRGIQSYPGMFPVEPRLRARLERIEAKHRPTSQSQTRVG